LDRILLKQKIVANLRHSSLLLLLAAVGIVARAQTHEGAMAQQLFEQERWQQLAELANAAPPRSADFDYELGIALAHLERWDESRSFLREGSRLAPSDKRFLIELGGVAFKQKKQDEAIAYLRRALRLDPEDSYANDFLATIYFIQGNLEAALKYWNRVGKPEIEQVSSEPVPRLRPALLDHAFDMAPASRLTLEELRTSNTRVQALDVFPSYRFDLVALPEGKFDAVFHASERNGFGDSKIQALLRTFRGLPFQEITPEYFNINHSAVNVVSLARWDPDKRRLAVGVTGPFRHDPRWRLQLSLDLRNENWDVVSSFTGQAPLLAALNLRREAGSVQMTRFVGSRWKWSVGSELSHRDFRNVFAGTALTPQLLAGGYQLKQIAQMEYEFLHLPERRLTWSGGLNSQAARLWSQGSQGSQPEQSFEKLQASLVARWFPRARGNDFETNWRVRANRTFGGIPFDELFMLGLERDTDLWLRAHVGVRDGRKGSAPLGRNYFLSNWESDKNIYSNGLVTLQLGPFFDSGKITDPSATLGSEKWLFDTGAQAKLRVMGVGVVFSYGKDLRTGNNAFFTTVSR
jgi:tetratricopeptide (TPR) repeat protein